MVASAAVIGFLACFLPIFRKPLLLLLHTNKTLPFRLTTLRTRRMMFGQASSGDYVKQSLLGLRVKSPFFKISCFLHSQPTQKQLCLVRFPLNSKFIFSQNWQKLLKVSKFFWNLTFRRACVYVRMIQYVRNLESRIWQICYGIQYSKCNLKFLFV